MAASRRRLPATSALVLCSPLERARHTAELAGLQRAEYLADLLEWDHGAWKGPEPRARPLLALDPAHVSATSFERERHVIRQ